MHPTSTLIGMIPTLNAERARTFYCDILGLTFVEDNGFAIFLRSGQNMIRLARVEAFEPYPFTLLGWEVADLVAEVRALTQKGLSFTRYPPLEQDADAIWIAPGGTRVAWFTDPDGNNLSLSQS